MIRLRKVRALIFILPILFILAWLLWPKQSSLSSLATIARTKYSSAALENSDVHFNLYCGRIYLGQLLLNIKEGVFQGEEVYETTLDLKPPEFLRKVSGDRTGLNVFSILSQKTLLPYYFEQNDSYRKKKGKKGRIVEYQHGQLTMLRKGRVEDIEDDTRDYASLILWLMKQNYDQEMFFKSTLNINRTIYLVLAKVKANSADQDDPDQPSVVQLRIKFIELTKDDQQKSSLSVDLYLLKVNDYYLPLFLQFREGVLTFTVHLN